MSARSRERSPWLLPALVAAVSLLLLVWWLVDRVPAFERSSLALERINEPAVAPAGTISLSEPRADAPQRMLVAAEEPFAEAAREPALATISGRLQVDGFAPFQGSVEIRRAGGEPLLTAAIDRFGRFYVRDVPAAELRLSFRMEWLTERQLLLPSVVVEPEPGETAVVDLDWTTRHVNVQVLAEGGAASRARVDLQGPNYAASFDTNERGKARLSLIGSGSFSLRASLPSGRTVEAALELDESDELETVLIAAAPAR